MATERQHANGDDNTGDADCGDAGAELMCVDTAAPVTQTPLTAAALVAHVRFEETPRRSDSTTSSRTVSVNSPTDTGPPTIAATPPEANSPEDEEEDLVSFRDALDDLDSVLHSRDSEFEAMD